MDNELSRGAGSTFGGKNFDFKKIMDWLGYVLKCPICGFKYNLKSTEVIESEQNDALGEAKILIHSDCGKCKSSVMFNIEIHGPEVFSVGMVTDLTSQDSSKFKHSTPITSNEIISLHKALKNFNGDFAGAFAKAK